MSKAVSILIAFLALAVTINGSMLQSQDRTTAPATKTTESTLDVRPDQPESPAFRGLDSNLYMQTSGEYRALCYQTFALAKMRLKDKLSQPSKDERPVAVVMDLDETILDNARFQTMNLRKGRAYEYRHWESWEAHGSEQVDLIPGAQAFIEELKRSNVQPIFITNRNDKAKAETMSILKRHCIEVPEELLLCSNDQTGSNKTSRRSEVGYKFRILLFVGDNLRDFDDLFRYDKKAGVDERKRLVDEHQSRFGEDWILMPNPAYGEWNKAFHQSERDLELLRDPS